MTYGVPVLIGGTVEVADPFTGVLQRGAEVAQVHLSAPRVWRAPVPRKDPEAWRAWDVPVYVHAPYLINPASVNPEVRAKSRVALQEQTAAAAAVGARGLVVHAGHPTGTGTLEDAVTGWVEVMRDWTPEVPILIENTASGTAGPGLTLPGFAALWEALMPLGFPLGVCLDTCHAWAAGWDLETCTAELVEICGPIDLVHANGSKDVAGAKRDRHENFDKGELPFELIAHIAREAQAPVVIETPGTPVEQRADIARLREALS